MKSLKQTLNESLVNEQSGPVNTRAIERALEKNSKFEVLSIYYSGPVSWDKDKRPELIISIYDDSSEKTLRAALKRIGITNIDNIKSRSIEGENGDYIEYVLKLSKDDVLTNFPKK
jgi:hypothetical protein